MSEKELEEFRRAILATREKRIASPEKARELLREEGVINADGSLTAQYATTAA